MFIDYVYIQQSKETSKLASGIVIQEYNDLLLTGHNSRPCPATLAERDVRDSRPLCTNSKYRDDGACPTHAPTSLRRETQFLFDSNIKRLDEFENQGSNYT